MHPFTQNNKISTTLQLVSIFAVASTFFGFLIVNIYLAIFGFWDFNFLKTEYFSAGGLFLFFVFLPATFFYAFFKAKEILEKYRVDNKSLLKSILIFIALTVLLLSVTSLSFFIFVFLSSLSNASYPNSFIAFYGTLWTLIIFGIVSTGIKSHKDIKDVRHKTLT